MKTIFIVGFACALMTSGTVWADAPTAPAPAGLASTASASSGSTRYGLFNWLDHRSVYGQGDFPEPFLVDDSDGEVNEARLDWLHTSGNDANGSVQHSDLITGEVEKGFGPLTLEVEVPVERDNSGGQISHGFGNVDLGARVPFYQVVSADGLIDTSFGVAGEFGIPVSSAISKNIEVVPKIFNDLKIGEHFTLQSILGYSTLLGGSVEGGLQTFEYGFVFGYTLPHDELPIPGVLQLIPIFELSGATEMNQADPGHDSLLGNIGFRANLDAVGPLQPRLGISFVFPIDNGASQDQDWGIDTSLVFEY